MRQEWARNKDHLLGRMPRLIRFVSVRHRVPSIDRQINGVRRLRHLGRASVYYIVILLLFRRDRRGIECWIGCNCFLFFFQVLVLKVIASMCINLQSCFEFVLAVVSTNGGIDRLHVIKLKFWK